MTAPPALSPRLSMVARLLPEGTVVADVGTDHGLLPVHLLAAGRIPRAIATDRLPQAAEQARRLAERHGVAGLLDVRVGEGLAPLRPGEAGAIVLAGMSGRTIARVIDEGAEVAASAGRLVLQPVQALPFMRRWAVARGWTIVAEELTEEDGRFYAAVALSGPPAGEARLPAHMLDKAVAEGVGFPPSVPAEYVWTVGPLLWRVRHPLLAASLRARARRHRETAMAIVPRGPRSEEARRRHLDAAAALEELANHVRGGTRRKDPSDP